MYTDVVTAQAAVDTAFNTQRDGGFRSRSELRWAAYLDEAGIKYEYKPGRYSNLLGMHLPGFSLPQLGYWLSVKRDYGLYDSRQLEAICNHMGALVAATQLPGIVVFGDPRRHTDIKFTPDAISDSGYSRTLVSFPNIDNGSQYDE